jgi:hypothetical protein
MAPQKPQRGTTLKLDVPDQLVILLSNIQKGENWGTMVKMVIRSKVSRWVIMSVKSSKLKIVSIFAFFVPFATIGRLNYKRLFSIVLNLCQKKLF